MIANLVNKGSLIIIISCILSLSLLALSLCFSVYSVRVPTFLLFFLSLSTFSIIYSTLHFCEINRDFFKRKWRVSCLSRRSSFSLSLLLAAVDVFIFPFSPLVHAESLVHSLALAAFRSYAKPNPSYFS